MTLDQSSIESLSRLGQYQKIVNDCGRDLSRVHRLPSIDHRLLLADSFAKVGNLEFAATIVGVVLQSYVTDSVLSRCEAILGWIAREQGVMDDATQRLQHSARLAKAAGNLTQAALSSILVFRIVSERQTPQAVVPLLTEIRTLVTQAGEPHLTALLHESVARQETQSANYDEARRHLRIAMTLVEAHPNAWLEQLCLINSFCISVYECDLRTAEDHLLRAVALIDVTGAFEPEIRNNQGHLYLHLGKFSRAEDVLARVKQGGSGPVPLSALDGLARLYLATGRLVDCEDALNRLEALQRPSAPATSFPYRSSLITRIRLLLQQRKWRAAAETADKAIRAGEHIGDRQLLSAATFLLAHALIGLGGSDRAARAIARASALGAWNIREHQGAFLHIAAGAAEGEGYHTLGSLLRSRAERVWHDHENVCSETEFKTQLSSSRIESNTRVDDQMEDRSASLINSVVGAFDVSYSPRLLGAELLTLIESMGCSSRAQIVESRVEQRDVSLSDDESRLFLGVHRNRNVTLVCRIPDDPVRVNSLSDVLRLGHSIVALAKAREHDRGRAALWPADPVEARGEALFVAEQMLALLTTARRIAATNVSVLITGETGTGKEVLARAIHAYSTRARGTFLPFNCSGTPKDMLDSQLFGHRRGAFTGAIESFQGVIRAASGGTLFLDEIGDMGLDVQPKLLRFLDSSEIHPVGEAHPLRVDVRVIAATNASLDTLVADGRFREDLFYRLNIVPLHVPPLRERRVEIPALASHYLAKFALEFAKGDLRLAEETMEYLVLYRWPGNVRQLANEMRRLAALAETGAVLMPEHLDPVIAASRRTIPASERVLEPTEVVVRLDQPMAAGVQHLERTMLRYALQKCGGRMEDTATMLGLSRKGLYLKRQRFGIDPPEAAPPAGDPRRTASARQ